MGATSVDEDGITTVRGEFEPGFEPGEWVTGSEPTKKVLKATVKLKIIPDFNKFGGDKEMGIPMGKGLTWGGLMDALKKVGWV